MKRLIVGVSVAFALLVCACTSQTVGSGARVTTAGQSEVSAAGQAHPLASSSTTASALGATLECIALKNNDLASGYTVTLLDQGDQPASLAMTQWLQSVLTCPATPVESPVIAAS